MTPAIDEILEPFEAGHAVLLLTGRSLRDLAVDEDGKVRPILEILRRTLRRRYGMALLTFSPAEGLEWDAARISDERDRRTIENALRAHYLVDIRSENQNVAIMRGVTSLCRTPLGDLKWSDGSRMRFGVLFEFVEHIVPAIMNGTQTDSQVVAIELAHLLANSLALRGTGNLVLLHSRDAGLIDELVRTPLPVVQLRQPGVGEKGEFLEALKTLYPNSAFVEDVTPESIVHASTNSPNRSLEFIMRASHRMGTKVTAKELAAQKQRDVEQLSEGTLRALDVECVANVELAGRNILAPLKMMLRLSKGLSKGDPHMPGGVILAGAPGTGKTDLALVTARDAGAAAYEVRSPKGPFVGQTERLAELQQRILKEWIPNIAFCDEISEALPIERNDLNTDSGASQAVTAALLSALGDETRRGKSLFIGATNLPQKLGAAMRSRFVVLPVLHPLRDDMIEIVCAIARRIAPEATVDVNDPHLKQAAEIFHEKGANARHVRSALSNAVLLRGSLDADSILFAAADLIGHTDRLSSIYADLWAIRLCTSKSFYPWGDDPTHYPYPDFLREIVDTRTGDVNTGALEKRIRELEPYANV